MNKYVGEFLSEIIKKSFFISLVISGFIILIFGINGGCQYAVGFVIGIINFALLALGINIIVLNCFKRAALVQTLFFILRYMVIAIVLAELIENYGFNVYYMAIGLLTVKLTLVLFSGLLNLNIRKGSQNG
ncbi:hypothetical protein Q428_00605 [Fervidicella metallireducens AeB]|uniref:ATP synthase subunit I n=1 Tax=Fervidicella metallireducens AeB TaxID=1403537 RepID=A0A017RZ63_9CLOT|nr:hypothetical protein [Fervidicella metallireducens]EYE89881.1 hypothetical protein Q428_00605 [Fervidicella metallireducens AeB]